MGGDGAGGKGEGVEVKVKKRRVFSLLCFVQLLFFFFC